MAIATVLTDLAGVEQGELAGVGGKNFQIPIGSLQTGSITLRSDHEDADFLLEGDALLKVYDTEVSKAVPLLHLRLITAEETEDAEGQDTVTCAWADPYWVLLRRLVGKSQVGYSRGTAVSPVDRGTIISEIVAATNAESPSGVRMGSVQASSSTYVEGWRYAKIAEKIAELCATLDGPDWRVRPIEWTGGYYGELDVQPVIGSPKPEAVFEFGPETLANVKKWRRAVSLEGTLNRVFHLPPGFPDNAVQGVLTEQDAASQAARGLLEDVVTAAQDLAVDELRQKLLQHHIATRKGPKQTITFEPVSDLGSRVPKLGRDFDVGDVVPFHAAKRLQDGRIQKRVDALFRVYQAALSVDEAGAATYSLTVTPSA